MFLTRKRAFARAGLLGNPSDGYHGKTVSFSVRNYWAEVVLYEWDSVEIVLADDDRARFTAVVPGRTRLAVGDVLELAVAPEEVHLFDPETGTALR